MRHLLRQCSLYEFVAICIGMAAKLLLHTSSAYAFDIRHPKPTCQGKLTPYGYGLYHRIRLTELLRTA